MQTENLDEMIQRDSSSPVDLNNPDYVYTLSSNKPMYEDVKNDVLNVKELAADSSTTRGEVTKQISTEAISTNNYQPESEEALIAYVLSQNNKIEVASIVIRWEIGRSINSFYKGKYGARELDKISKETGIGTNSLHKMCRFARIYTAEQLHSLLKGCYTLTWFDIAQNLAVEPIRVTQAFDLSKNYGDFLIQIKRLKDPGEKRGKSKLPISIEAKPMNVEKHEESKAVPAEIITAINPEIADMNVAEKPITLATEKPYTAPYKDFFPDYNPLDTKIGPDEPAKHCETCQKTLDMLKLDNERLKKDLLSRDVKITELEKALSDVKREKERYENSYYACMHRLDKIREGLESNTPVTAILGWMDNGG